MVIYYQYIIFYSTEEKKNIINKDIVNLVSEKSYKSYTIVINIVLFTIIFSYVLLIPIVQKNTSHKLQLSFSA